MSAKKSPPDEFLKIAAAPLLLDVLIYLRDCIESGREPGMGNVHRAIAKATGGAS